MEGEKGQGGVVAAAMASGSWGTLGALAEFVREEVHLTSLTSFFFFVTLEPRVE